MQASDEKGKKKRFQINSYVSPKVKAYEKSEAIGCIAHYSAKLRNLCFAEVVNIEKISEETEVKSHENA